MGNEPLLETSYFVDLGVAVLAGIVPWLLLQGFFRRLCVDYLPSRWAAVLPRLFLMAIVLPPVMGFTSVSYFSCTHSNYEQIVADREHLIAVSRQQIETAFLYGLVAVLTWSSLAAVLVGIRDRRAGARRAGPRRERW